jgi:arylsulfatase A
MLKVDKFARNHVMFKRPCLFVCVMKIAAILSIAAVRQSQAEDPQGRAPGDKPNIVVILADDFGYECVRANGGTSYSTPHLDRLAAQGARYEHCYTQPLCTPTRAQLMTGQLNVRNYIRFGFLDPQQKTFAHVLKRSGYATGIFGKWQLGNGADGPGHFGFDEHVLWQLTRRPPRYANPGLEIAGREVDFHNGEYGPDLVQNAAIDFVNRHQGHPFLLYYPMMLTHAPFQPTPESADWDPKAIGEDVNHRDDHFADMVAHLDTHVGQLIDHLDRLKLRENTLIVFVGDNGTAAKLNSQWSGKTIRGAKGQTTDAGMRVPLIVNWPGRIPEGRVVSDLVDTTDILPTICEATKSEAPAGVILDGRSLLPSATGLANHPREWLYSWYWPNQNGQASAKPIELARTHRFKLYGDGRLFELDGQYGEVELDNSSLNAEALAAKTQLSGVIAQYANARPQSLTAVNR